MNVQYTPATEIESGVFEEGSNFHGTLDGRNLPEKAPIEHEMFLRLLCIPLII
jgi:hypothetical protein